MGPRVMGHRHSGPDAAGGRAATLGAVLCALVTWGCPTPAVAAPFDVYYRAGPQSRWTFYGGRETKAAADAAAAELGKATGDETKVVALGEPHPNAAAIAAGPVDRTIAIRGSTYVSRPGLGYRPGFYRWGGGTGWGGGWGGGFGGWGARGWGGGWGRGYGGGWGGGSHHGYSSSHHHHHHSSSHHSHSGSHAGSHPTSHAHAGRTTGRAAGHHAAGHHAHSHSHSHQHSHGHAHGGHRR